MFKKTAILLMALAVIVAPGRSWATLEPLKVTKINYKEMGYFYAPTNPAYGEASIIKMAAQVAGTTINNGVASTATRWLPLTLTGTMGGGLIGAAAMLVGNVVLGVAIDATVAWMSDNALSVDPTTKLVRLATQVSGGVTYSNVQSNTDIVGHFTGNGISGVVYAPWGTGDPLYYIQSMPDFQNSIIDMGSLWAPGYVDSLGVSWYIRSYRPFNSPSGPFTLVASPQTTANQVAARQGSTTYSTPSGSAVNTLAINSLANGDQKARNALMEVLDNINGALTSPDSQMNKTQAATLETMKGILAQGVSSGDQATLETATATPATQAELNRLGNQSLSPSDVKNAVRQGIDESAGGDASGPPMPPQDIPDPPTQGDLPGALGTFWTAIMALPMMNIFSQMTVTASGSSVISFQIPSFAGGASTSFSFDFAQYSSTWNFMGSILFLMNAWSWLIYLFESR